ncbi:MAG: ABC transporter ATP-binding protein [Chloroflexi bacterium]|nr:ABC transporter ATP-binding protein [Chloroflexota bacterium]
MIEVNNLSFTYPGGKKQAIRNLNFDIQHGEIFGFLGPSGAGKSTTQKILFGLLKGYEGRINIFGKELTDWGQEYFERIGVSFELPNHYLKLTALENLNYFRSLYSRQTNDPNDLLALVGLEEDANTLVGQFSKGMKMRLNFVRSLLHQPDLLFLDEPTTGLDPVNARNIKEIIMDRKQQGTTVFLTTHDMTVADELCDRVAFIVDGEIKVIDAPKALKLQYGERKVRVEYGLNSHMDECDFELDGLGHNEEFLRLIREQRIETIHTKESTLESIFIELTGRELE